MSRCLISTHQRGGPRERKILLLRLFQELFHPQSIYNSTGETIEEQAPTLVADTGQAVGSGTHHPQETQDTRIVVVVSHRRHHANRGIGWQQSYSTTDSYISTLPISPGNWGVIRLNCELKMPDRFAYPRQSS